MLKTRTAERSTQPPTAYALIRYAVGPVIKPEGKKNRSSRSSSVRRSSTPGASSTKMAAGIICAAVSTACDASTASRFALGLTPAAS